MAKTKILFIVANDSKVLFPELYGADGSSPARGLQESNDYLTDAIFQYLKTNDEFEVYECPWMAHMYANSPVKKEQLSGCGFALRKTIESSHNVLTVDDAIHLISDKEFDYVITDSRTWSSWWQSRGLSPFQSNAVRLLNKAMEVYPRNNIIFFDGEDQTSVHESLVGKVTYFKRELTFDNPLVNPIGYCFPESKFRWCPHEAKTKLVATVIPGDKTTYKFTEEDAYYDDYRVSFYGFTWKKLGWDCFRHHELLFSSCVPIFPDIAECPRQTLTRFPKDICQEVLNTGILTSARKFQQFQDLYCFVDLRLDATKISKMHYADLQGRLKEHAMKYLSSKSVAEYVFSRAGEHR